MKVALVGFSGSGKSTCFKAIIQKHKDELKHIDPTKSHIETIKIPDERLASLESMFKPKKVTNAELLLEDLPGFHIPQIKDVDAMMEVVGIFSGRDAGKDIDDMDIEFLLADHDIVQKRLGMIDKELKGGAVSKEKELERDALRKCEEVLKKNMPLRGLELSKEERKLLRGYQFLSQKPIMVILNISETQRNSEAAMLGRSRSEAKGLKSLEFCGELEREIADLDDEDKEAFLKEYAIDKGSRDALIKAMYAELGLITFFTTKHDEARAWIIENGTHALDAAGKIHTDIKRGFIKAEVVNFSDLIKCGSMDEARKKGVMKLEGKDYVVRDGDIIDFRFNI